MIFTFRPTTSPPQRESALREIGAWAEVDQAGLLHPELSSESLGRVCVATVAAGVAPETLLERLTSLPEVESASLPAERYLVS